MTGRLKYWFIAAALGTLPLIVLGFLWRPTAAAGLWYVAPGGDDANDCQTTVTPCATINAAIGKAAPGDTIDVATGTYTAATGNQVVWITQSVTLLGGWDSAFVTETGLSIVDGDGVRVGMAVQQSVNAAVDRFVFQNGNGEAFIGGGGVNNLGNLSIAHSRIVSNTAGFIDNSGGGLVNYGVLTLTQTLISENSSDTSGGGVRDFGPMTMIRSSVTNNNAGFAAGSSTVGGGGIMAANTTLVIVDSTISGNVLHGSVAGAGIYSEANLTVTNSTISNNSGGIDGAGITTFGGRAAIFNTTISENGGYGIDASGPNTMQNSLVSGNGIGDCKGGVASAGYNLVTKNLGCTLAATDIVGAPGRLDTVQDNGGPTPTQVLLPGSPAINGGNPGGCFGPDGLLASDQRGYPRLGRCDIGAFEAQAVEFAEKTVSKSKTQPGQSLNYQINLGNGGSNPISNMLVTDTLPAGVNYANGSLSATSGNFHYAAGVITWTGSVNAGATVTLQFDASTLPNASLGTVITNTAIINGDGELFSRRAVTTLALAKLYLPLISKPLPGIQGYITVNGAPASGIFLELRRFDGHSYSTQANTTTDGSGFYNFTGAPSLPPGQFYYVRYLNTGGVLGYLSFWGTAKITSFTAGSAFGAGSFDLADVQLAAPNPGATVALPALFQWVRRPATTSDSYQLSLFDPNGNAFGQTGLLGYVNGVTLTGVSSDFHSGTPYGWYVAINSPDGGYGESYYYRRVTFANVLAGGQPAVTGATVLAPATAPVDRPRP